MPSRDFDVKVQALNAAHKDAARELRARYVTEYDRLVLEHMKNRGFVLVDVGDPRGRHWERR